MVLLASPAMMVSGSPCHPSSTTILSLNDHRSSTHLSCSGLQRSGASSLKELPASETRTHRALGSTDPQHQNQHNTQQQPEMTTSSSMVPTPNNKKMFAKGQGIYVKAMGAINIIIKT
jgi:hypothetical protein